MTINPYGKEIVKVSTELCGRELSLEVGRVGFRSTSSVIVRYGETVVLATAQIGGRPAYAMDYFPLSVDYEEKMYAAGKISGSRFIKREGRPSDDAVLIGRLIDRPIRPLFPKGYRQEVQAVVGVLSMDPTFRPDMVAMIAMSSALMLSGAPFDGPIAGLRVGINDKGDFEAFMSREALDAGELDLVVAGKEDAIMMVEAGASEVPEETIVKALAWANEAMKPALKLQEELAKKVKVEPLPYELVLPDEELQKKVDTWTHDKLGEDLHKAYPERNELIATLRSEFDAAMEAEVGEDYASVKGDYHEAFTMALHKDVRKGIVESKTRPDGRKLDEIRQLSSEVGLLPRAHGSSLFTRGMTQALNIVTLAPLSFSQMVDTMEQNDGSRRYMHHYNAPGYTVGEIKRLGSAGRREIGHGYLAERAVTAVLPSEEDFPYAIRTVTEIMSQNGSTSMAATCSSVLALMDAGVPLKRPVSGIAMGLMMDGDTPYVMSDIADAEDFAGDMDFKVTGTEKGVTALQMDMKVHGLPVAILAEALEKGKVGRAHILEHMLTTLAEPRNTMSPYAPRIEKIMVKPEKIGAIIGKGGETINKITSETGAQVDIKDDGLVTIASNDAEAIKKAVAWIKSLVEEPEVGKIYEGQVVKIMEFGAFVNIMPGIDGMVHISQMSEDRVEKVTDIVKEGDVIKVKLNAIDERGRLNLSMKDAK